MNVDFSAEYIRSPDAVMSLLNKPDARIVEKREEISSRFGGTSTKGVRYLYVGETNCGQIENVAEQILARSIKTVRDVQIAHKLSQLCEQSDQNLSAQETGVRSRIRGIGRRAFTQSLKDVSGSFSDIYANDPGIARRMLQQDLLNSHNMQIVEVERVRFGRAYVERHIYIEGEDFGPIDALAMHIIEKPNKTFYDLEIAHALSKEYTELNQRSRTSSSDLIQAGSSERIRLSRELQKIVADDFVNLLDRGKKIELQRLYHEDAYQTFSLISAQTANHNEELITMTVKDASGTPQEKTLLVRHDYMDSLRRGLSKQPLAILTQEHLAQDIHDQGLISEIRVKKERYDRLNQEIERIDQQRNEIDDKFGEIDVDIFRLDREIQSIDKRILDINALMESGDPLLDLGSLQNELSACIENRSRSQEELDSILTASDKREQYALLLQYKEESMIHEEEACRIRTEHEIAKSEYFEILTKAFLMDLYVKLGPEKKHLIYEILLFLEQTFTGYLTSQLNAHFPDPTCIPKHMRAERTITIHPNRVVLKLELNCSREFRGGAEEIPDLPCGIKTTLQITLGEKAGDTTLLVTAEKLEDAPTSTMDSEVYPIIVAQPTLKRSNSDTSTEGNTTTDSDSSRSGSVSPNSGLPVRSPRHQKDDSP